MNELGKMVRLKSCLVSDRIVNFDAPKVDQIIGSKMDQKWIPPFRRKKLFFWTPSKTLMRNLSEGQKNVFLGTKNFILKLSSPQKEI